MTATVRGFTTGWLETDLAGLLEGGEGQVRIPVLSYLVEHPKGSLVFDTGLHTDMRVDPVARIGGLAGVLRQRAGRRTRQSTSAPPPSRRPPDMIVCSHLHFDHCGGNALLGDVPVVVQRTEWEAAHGGDAGAAYLPADYDTGQDVRLVDGEHDLFGDGSVVCIPTPGHTAGHQSLRVRTAERELVLTGDACYFRQSLETSKLPLFGHDREPSSCAPSTCSGRSRRPAPTSCSATTPPSGPTTSPGSSSGPSGAPPPHPCALSTAWRCSAHDRSSGGSGGHPWSMVASGEPASIVQASWVEMALAGSVTSSSTWNDARTRSGVTSTAR